MKAMDKVKVWNHTFGGELIEEGVATLRRKDPSFKGETIDVLFTSGVIPDGEDRNKKEGPFERWMVTFPDEPKSPYSRWVREEDLVDPFAKANKRLEKLAKIL